MKTSLSLGLVLAILAPAQAQIFRSGGVNAAARSHEQPSHRDGRDDGRSLGRHGHSRGAWTHGGGHFGRHDGWRRPHFSYYPYAHGHGYGYLPGYGYYGGYGYGYPYYGSFGYYGSGSAAAQGLLLGALAGGIVGHNSRDFRHNGWRGAAWGAGAGWLIGSVLDSNRRAAVYQSAPVVVQQLPVAAYAPPAQPAPAAQPQQVTIINTYYNSANPMSGVNALFGR